GQCPFEWKVKDEGDSCYYRTKHNATWEEGYTYCTDQGGDMLHILDKAENDLFDEQKYGDTWLGMLRSKSDPIWKWKSTNKPIGSFSNWVSPSQQDDTADCAQMNELGEWMPAKCDSEAFVICEFNPGYNPFMLIGPVIAVCGVVLLLMSIETCIRRREFLEKNGTELMDDVDEPHEGSTASSGVSP
ncbi:unnamed protein product, partial [Meganyctiphanes norvegica]